MRRPVLAASLLFAFALSTVPVRGAPQRPNVIFFLSDDHRADFLSCAGHPIVKTPTIDRLAASGVRFTNAFVTTSICAASRATLLTGVVERTHGFTFGTPPIPATYSSRGYAALLRTAGYRTGFVGKFGVAMEPGERERSFDVFRPLGRSPYFHRQPDGTFRHETDLAADHAIEFLRSSHPDRPFALSVSFNAPHAEDGDKVNHFPWPPSADGLYDDVEIPPPPRSDPAVFESQPEFLRTSLNRERWYWRWDTPEKFQRNVRAYFRMITGVDHAIGRVLEALDAAGRAGDTIVVFSGDNGYYQGSRGFAGKWSHYEESLRVPLVVFDPRAPVGQRGRTNDAMVLNLDVPATIVDLAGLPVPAGYQGRSLTPLLRGLEVPDWRKDFFCEHLMEHEKIPKWEGVRDERWVYARYFEQSPVFEFLHDLQSDPEELRNLASDLATADALARLRARCDELRDGYGGVYDAERVRRWKAGER